MVGLIYRSPRFWQSHGGYGSELSIERAPSIKCTAATIPC